MNTTQAQQKALDDALVAPADRIEFGKCNMRLKTDIKPKEATFQVVLDALALTPFYQTFLITAEVPAIYMQEFWATFSVHKSSIRIMINKKKFSLDAFAFGEKALKPKYVQKKANSDTSPKKKTVQATKGTRIKSKAKVAKSDKKKQPVKIPKAKGLNVLSEVALTEAEQMKLATKRSKTQFHISHASGSGDAVDTQSKVPDEQQQKVTGTNIGAGVIPEVPDVPKYDSESEEESWTFSQDDKDDEEESDRNDDSKETESDNDGDDLTHPNLSTYKADEEGKEEEKADDEEVSSDQRVSTPPDYELTNEEENKEGDDKDKEANQDMEDTHVTLTTVPPVLQQQSSSISSDLVSKFINPSPDIGIDSILNQDTQSDTLVNVPVSVAAETPSSVTTIPQPPIPNIQPLQQTPTSTTTTTNPTMTLPEIPNFASLF
ncbi:hypothetical protein Tco_0533148 [Tanacetum coccineum]